MEVAAVIVREESQIENLHDHLQSDKEQRKEQQTQENSKEPLEQNQLPQLSEHEICSRPDESNQPLTSKTAKAAEVVIDKTPEMIQLEKLRNNLNRNPKSSYYANRYENHLAKIQVLVLKATKQLQSDIKVWDATFLMQNNRLPNANDYELSDEVTSTLHKKKVALKLLQSWKITVHL